MVGVKGMIQAGQIGERRAVKIPVWARAREFTDEAVRFWASLMRDESASEMARLRASENLMDRAWGKSPVIVMGDDDGPARINLAVMTAEQSAALEGALMALVGDAIAADPRRGRSLEGSAAQADSPMPVLALPNARSDDSESQLDEQTTNISNG